MQFFALETKNKMYIQKLNQESLEDSICDGMFIYKAHKLAYILYKYQNSSKKSIKEIYLHTFCVRHMQYALFSTYLIMYITF